ncbi:M20/M25/M40 family metallo-hydrolase [Kingella negevensis]|uniref:M20/M25/M40 family metallo-hydrolase n=1 Tax=Kingella negevensis TaxID=1522312 RepID=UPI00254A7A68|nr:M20/M25/M40 family metallo-hydrolase [Kingella negevensis]MDK4696864.1 M20/M25/M40 family metallo-hydrolase [Kingella negevensis]
MGLTCWVDKNATGDKANLFATLPASNGETQGGLVLSGHTDVVPVDGQDWATNPFELTEQNGKLYGRGASDMKGFIASVLGAIDNSKKEAKDLRYCFHTTILNLCHVPKHAYK